MITFSGCFIAFDITMLTIQAQICSLNAMTQNLTRLTMWTRILVCIGGSAHVQCLHGKPGQVLLPRGSSH